MKKFAFIIGAHKTGTTNLNKLLLENRAQLLEKGIRFEASGSVKLGLTKYLTSKHNESHMCAAREYIRSNCEQFSRAIFSHENISGTVPGFIRRAEFFPRIGEKLNVLRHIMQGEPVDLLFFIRGYSDFIHSCYSEFMRSEGYISFSDFLASSGAMSWSWNKPVDDILRGYPEATLTLIDRSQKSSELDSKIISFLVGNTELSLSRGVKIGERRALSAKGLQVIKAFDKRYPGQIDGQMIDKIARMLPKSAEFGALDLVDKESRKDLNERYLIDVNSFRQKNLLRIGG